MKDYQKEQIEERQIFVSLLASIATYLDGWDVDEQKTDNTWGGVISGENGLGMGVSQDRGKLKISGCWPRTIKGDVYYPRDKKIAIGVSASRTPKSIAQDIQRRFLPAYLKEYEHQCEFVRKAETEVERICQNITEIADVLGVEVNRGMSDDPRGLRTYYDTKHGRATFEHRYTREFEITIRNADLDLTIAIAQLLKEKKRE